MDLKQQGILTLLDFNLIARCRQQRGGSNGCQNAEGWEEDRTSLRSRERAVGG